MRLLSRQTLGPLFSFLSQRNAPLPITSVGRAFQSSSTSLQMSSSFSSAASSNADNNGTAAAAAAAAAGKDKKVPVIAQYIFLRRDLDWPAGAMAAQAAHASVAAIAEGLAAQHEATATYVSPEQLPRMTKMVYGVDNLEQLESVKEAWNKLIQSTEGDNNDTSKEDCCLQAYWWVEQPENIPSAMATWPIVRTNKVSKVIKNLKLSYF